MRGGDSICIVGAGAVGGGFARALAKAGWRVTVVSRDPQARRREFRDRRIRVSAEPVYSPIYLLSVPDGEYRAVARGLATDFPPEHFRAVFLHTSGARPVSDLKPLAKFGSTGALHPFVPVERGRALPEGIPLTFQGDAKARARAEQVAAACGAAFIPLPARADRLRYHAAAVLACNLPFALWLEAEQLLAPWCAGDRAAARALLTPALLEAAVNYAARGGAGLTGPAARGDRKLIAAEARRLPASLRALFLELNGRLLRRRSARR